MAGENNYTSLQRSNKVIEVSESKFNALIVEEVVECMINDESIKKHIKHKHLFNLKQWSVTYNMLENQTSILNNVVKRFKSNPNHESFKKITTNSLEINTHNRQTLNENTLKNSQTNPKMIAVIEDELNFRILIPKEKNTKPIKTKEKKDYTIIDTIELDDSDDSVVEVDVTDGSQETIFGYGLSQKSITKNVSGRPITFSNELHPVIDEVQKVNSRHNLSETKHIQPSKLKTVVTDPNDSVKNGGTKIKRIYKPGPRSKTKDELYNLEEGPTVLNDYHLNNTDVEDAKSKTINTSNAISTQQSNQYEPFNTYPTSKISLYPPPYPKVPLYNSQQSWKMVPSAPILTIETLKDKFISLTWDMKLSSYIAQIREYELYLCQETEQPPDTSMWKLIGTIEANALPMVCKLELFKEGFTYYFAMRAVDIHKRRGPCSVAKTTI